VTCHEIFLHEELESGLNKGRTDEAKQVYGRTDHRSVAGA
jgi:hypothetical protein